MLCVPCGRCPKCIKRKVSQWSFRLLQEEKHSLSAHFITLTYATRHLPFRNGGWSICKRDVQLFIKRLRKSSGDGSNIKYFAVGEYGGRFKRPHYHIIMFNATPELICKAWMKGHVHLGTVTGASVGYCLKYMSKRVWKRKVSTRKRGNPEFALMSKGIGKGYLTKKMISWHRKGKRMYCVLEDGKKVSLPRYYKDRLFCKVEKQVAGIAGRKAADEEVLKGLAKYGGRYYEIKQNGIEAAIHKMELEAEKN